MLANEDPFEGNSRVKIELEEGEFDEEPRFAEPIRMKEEARANAPLGKVDCIVVKRDEEVKVPLRKGKKEEDTTMDGPKESMIKEEDDEEEERFDGMTGVVEEEIRTSGALENDASVVTRVASPTPLTPTSLELDNSPLGTTPDLGFSGMESPGEDFDTVITRTIETMRTAGPRTGKEWSMNTTQVVTYTAKDSETTQQATIVISSSETSHNEEDDGVVDSIPTSPKARPPIPYMGGREESRGSPMPDYSWTSPREAYYGNEGFSTPSSIGTSFPQQNRGAIPMQNMMYQGMSPPPTPTWYMNSAQPSFMQEAHSRGRSTTPNAGANAMDRNARMIGGNQMLPPTRLAGRTPSASSTQSSSAGQKQWSQQCELSSERMSAYSNAQKLWERLGAPETAVMGDPTMGYDELAVEIAMRGRRHVLEGIEKGSRTAFKNWRATVENTKRQGKPVSSLFEEYERSIAEYRKRAQEG